jgi:hypothetical protein
MTDLLETRLNDTIFSATSSEFNILGAPFVGILSLDYEQKRERKLVYGARKDGTPLGMTGGKYGIGSFGMSMLRSSYQRLIELLSLKGFGSYGDASFPISAVYAEPLALLKGVPPIVIAIEGCRIISEKDTNKEGIDEAVTEVGLAAMSLTRNGMRLWSVINGTR